MLIVSGENHPEMAILDVSYAFQVSVFVINCLTFLEQYWFNFTCSRRI